MAATKVPQPKRGDDGWDYTCPRARCGWTTRGWPSKREATSRRDQHELEHATGEPAPELAEVQ